MFKWIYRKSLYFHLSMWSIFVFHVIWQRSHFIVIMIMWYLWDRWGCSTRVSPWITRITMNYTIVLHKINASLCIIQSIITYLNIFKWILKCKYHTNVRIFGDIHPIMITIKCDLCQITWNTKIDHILKCSLGNKIMWYKKV